MKKIQLSLANYKLFPYEKELAFREIQALLNPSSLLEFDGQIVIEIDDEKLSKSKEALNRLTYFHQYSIEGHWYSTHQKNIEEKCIKTGKQKRQSTRYGSHGLHDYKGKFNPQIVSALINIFGLDEHQTILEPFCGSGTTLLEAVYNGVNCVGFDINPLAVFIANTKTQAINAPLDELEKLIEDIEVSFYKERNSLAYTNNDDRTQYLKNWFSEEIFLELETLEKIIAKQENRYTQNIMLCCASNILREYSLQEPKDLRIRRRKSDMPSISFIEAFTKECRNFIFNSVSTNDLIERRSNVIAHNTDIREKRIFDNFSGYDAAITSPPYATALPYIDTQRLSLVWLRLCTPKHIKTLEGSLIGSREISTKNRKEIQHILEKNQFEIPKKLHQLCVTMQSALVETDGFRRQAVPMLMYRYFSDMQKMFKNTSKMVKKGAPFALVVGHNHTTLGGTKFDLNTPEYLSEIAENNGWLLQENTTLNAYHRYGLHSGNSSRLENLLILRNQC